MTDDEFERAARGARCFVTGDVFGVVSHARELGEEAARLRGELDPEQAKHRPPRCAVCQDKGEVREPFAGLVPCSCQKRY